MASHRLIEDFWYSRSKFTWLLWPFNLLFLLLVTLKRVLYLSKIIPSNQFDKSVLVVGNISVGGTGKTPFINQLVRLLAENGIKAGIVSRGYGSHILSYPHQVTKGDTVEEVGDEAFMQFLDLNVKDDMNIPLVIDPSRSKAVNYLIDSNEVDLVISDDGMQHYKMTRDIEVLLFDGKRQFGNRLILPFGPLREPLSRLKKVDIVVQNGLKENKYTKYKTFMKTQKLVNLMTGEEFVVETFSQKQVIAVAGIGNPERFFDSLEKICGIKDRVIFPDHYAYRAEDLKQFSNDIIVMTEKDASKCYKFAQDDWYYLKVEMQFSVDLSAKLLEYISSSISKRNEV